MTGNRVKVLADFVAGNGANGQIPLHEMYDSLPVAIYTTDAQGRVTYFNPAAARLAGRAPEIGSDQWCVTRKMFLPDGTPLPYEECPMARVLKGREVPGGIECIAERPDGTCVWFTPYPTVLRDAEGRITGGINILIDISSRKNAEIEAGDITKRTEAERASLLLAAIVDSSDDAIVSKNLDGTITSWNKSAERLLGYTAEEAVGQSITLIIPAERLEEEPQIIARLRRGERVDHFETQRVRKDGTLIDLSLTISPVKDRSGTVIGASKIARDITERRLAEIRQKRVEDQLRRANEDLEQFAYSASHDLQEPLRSVKIFSELLALDYGDALEGEAQEYLKYLRTGASRMEMLVRDLLSYTQVTKYDKPTEPSPAEEAFSAAIASLSSAISDARAQVTVDPLPVLPVHGAHLQQLFQNLVGNAIKYRSPDRPPTVHVGAVRADGQWLFSVSDNGIGIEPEYKENIFGLFKRLHTSDEYSGTGLGLAICQRIVERYRGRIWVESQPGRGSTFRFTLPT